jgi:hypothetical protein
MTRTKINLIKVSVLVLIVILTRNIILNCITLYKSVGDDENTILTLLSFILGTIFGLVARYGLTLLFWYSYNIKYPNEKYNEKVLKKIIACLLFLSIISAVFWGTRMTLVFIIFTLAILIREEKITEAA